MGVAGEETTQEGRLTLELLERGLGLRVGAEEAGELRLLLPHVDGLLKVELALHEKVVDDPWVSHVVVGAEKVAHLAAKDVLRHVHVEDLDGARDLAEGPPVQVHHACLTHSSACRRSHLGASV